MNIYHAKDMKFAESIFAPFLLIAIGLVLSTSAFVGFLQYWQNTETIIARESERLDFALQQAARDLKTKTADAARNVRMLAGTPPIQGILDARSASNSVSETKAKEAVWKDRLAQIFLSVAETDPDLLQVRLIDKSGKELVRVNSDEGKANRVEAKDLQDKGNRPYFQETMKSPRDAVRFFGIDLNLERGVVQIPHTAVLRTATKVYGRGNKLLGVMVINVNMNRVIRNLQNVVNREQMFLMTDATGKYFAHRDHQKTFGTERGTKFRLQNDYPDIARLLTGNATTADGASWSIQNDAYIARVARLYLSEDTNSDPILISTITPMETLMAQNGTMRNQIIMITALLALAGAIIASVLTRHLVRPLQLLTKATRNLSMGAPLDSLKVEGRNRKDEVGILLRSVYHMATRLEEKQERIKAILATAENPILSINEKGIIKDVNMATSKLFGYSRKELLGKNVSILMNAHDQKHHDDYLKNYSQGGEPKIIGVGREVTAIRKDGTPVQIHLAISKMRIKQETYYTGIMTDLTELKKVDKMKSEFVSKVSHELRTPLTSIKGSLGLVRTMMPAELSEQANKMLDIAYGNCDRLTNLVNDILDIEKIESGQLSYEFNLVDIEQLLQQSIEANLSFGRQYNVSLRLECHDKDLLVSGDLGRLQQVVTNLISNAVKFSPTGSEVVVTATRQKDNVRISVTDFGKGIPENFRDRIFNKFAQADDTGACKSGGSGLGLAISREIVRAHGGDIHFETETDMGTTFHVLLRLDQASILEQTDQSHSSPAMPNPATDGARADESKQERPDQNSDPLKKTA